MRLARSGEGVALPVLWELAQRWYGDRLSPSWRPRTREESQRILESVRLVGDFWRLP
jgi:hypothetical protein